MRRNLFAALASFLVSVACDPALADSFTPTPPACPSGLDGWPQCPCRHGHQCVDDSTFCGAAGVCVYAVPVGR